MCRGRRCGRRSRGPFGGRPCACPPTPARPALREHTPEGAARAPAVTAPRLRSPPSGATPLCRGGGPPPAGRRRGGGGGGGRHRGAPPGGGGGGPPPLNPPRGRGRQGGWDEPQTRDLGAGWLDEVGPPCRLLHRRAPCSHVPRPSP